MAEETKEQAGGKALATIGKVILGIVLIVAGAYLVWRWRLAVRIVIEGFIGFALILAGLIALAIAKE